MAAQEPPAKKARTVGVQRVFVWDFTIHAIDGVFPAVASVEYWMRRLAKKWCFQKEKASSTGTLHYQGRMSLYKKKRRDELVNLLQEKAPEVAHMYICESSNNSCQGDCFYVLKLDTKVEGPWKDTDPPPPYIPRQYMGMEGRIWPWQRTVWDSAEFFDARSINFIFDPRGNNGKTTIAALTALLRKGFRVPPINDAKELIQAVCDKLMATEERRPGPLFIDLPRSMPKSCLKGIFQAIEEIKNGHVCDTRYKYREWWFDAPPVWVFANEMVDLSLLSQDRWKLWMINRDHELVKLDMKFVYNTC